MNFNELKKLPIFDELEGISSSFNEDTITKDYSVLAQRCENSKKILKSIEDAIEATGLKDGMTISFHHHFRDGDYVVNKVMKAIANMGIKNLVIAASSLSDIHSELIEHIKNGVIKRIETSGLRGELANEISKGLMEYPVVFRSHGGRAYAIEKGQIKIDVAFLGAPSCDPFGNANGYSREDDNSVMCGSMGYAKCDAQYAKQVVIVTDNIVPFPNAPFGIPQSDVDYIVKIDCIGDPAGIMSGATRFTKNPKELIIAESTTEVIDASGCLTDGFSIQMGTGGASLAVSRFLEKKMTDKKITASFALGGITGSMVDLLEKGLIKRLLDVQSFDLKAAESMKTNRFHQQISSQYYASIGNEGTAVNQLDIVVLSALEVDVNFNANVLTGSDGIIRGAIGGHQDTAAGACISIVVCPLYRGRIPCIVDKVKTIITPGKTVDVVVTEQGIAVNPLRPELRKQLINRGLNVVDIGKLKEETLSLTGIPKAIEYSEKIVGIVTYRDGTVIDIINAVK